MAAAGRRLALAPYFRGKSRLERLVIPRLPLPRPIALPDGFTMSLDPASAYERDLYFRACEPDTYSFIRSALRPGMTVIDCGANLGFYTLLASVTVGPLGRVFSFEPTPQIFARLLGHIDANQLTNVSAMPLALSDVNGEAHLWEMRSVNHGMNTLIDGYDDGVDLGVRPVARLDDTLPGIHADLVKVDVEGSELNLLRGAVRTIATATLIVELSRPTMRPFGYEPEDVLTFLRSLRDYNMYWPHRGKLEPVLPNRRLPHYAVLGEDHGSNYVYQPAE